MKWTNKIPLLGILLIIIAFVLIAHKVNKLEKTYEKEIDLWQYEATFNAGYINGMKDVLMFNENLDGTTNNIFRSQTAPKNEE